MRDCASQCGYSKGDSALWCWNVPGRGETSRQQDVGSYETVSVRVEWLRSLEQSRRGVIALLA
jgi:hypothetical protein